MFLHFIYIVETKHFPAGAVSVVYQSFRARFRLGPNIVLLCGRDSYDVDEYFNRVNLQQNLLILGRGSIWDLLTRELMSNNRMKINSFWFEKYDCVFNMDIVFQGYFNS